jgi:hypothetical protein
MIKLTFAAAALAIALIQPAFAEDAMKATDAMAATKCDDSSMMKLQTEVDAMSDPAMKDQKDMAMKEVAMAKDSMKAAKTDDCMMHMKGAMGAMHKN